MKRVSRLLEIPGIEVDKRADAADAAKDLSILRLENLDTDVAPPKAAILATQLAIAKDENNSYLPFLGQEGVRKAVVKRVQELNHLSYDWKKECFISAGGMSGILNCLLATIEEGDEVIVTDPVYAGIINRIRLVGGKPIFVPLTPSKEGWRLNKGALKKAVSPRTKMVVMSPGMPGGHVLTREEWQEVANVCNQTGAWLLYDAAMERILYDKREILHPASFEGMREKTITVGAATKELRMIGWRVGWILGPEEIMKDIGLVSISNVVCQTGISMAGVAAGLEEDEFFPALKIWEERRDVLMEELKDLPVIPPHGGWSFLLDAQALSMSAEELAERLFFETKIAATPMRGWGEEAKKYVRFVFSNESKERLFGIGDKIKTVLKR